MIIVDKRFPYIHFLSGEEIFERAFNEASDEERHLIKLTAPELARKYQEAKVAKDESKCVLIEHYLNLRLVMLQVQARSRASWMSLLGVFLSGLLGFVLGKFPSCP